MLCALQQGLPKQLLLLQQHVAQGLKLHSGALCRKCMVVVHQTLGSSSLVCVAMSPLQIDGMKNRVLMKRFNVLGFPSIYLLKDGSTWQYSGVRSVPEVREWVTAALLVVLMGVLQCSSGGRTTSSKLRSWATCKWY